MIGETVEKPKSRPLSGFPLTITETSPLFLSSLDRPPLPAEEWDTLELSFPEEREMPSLRLLPLKPTVLLSSTTPPRWERLWLVSSLNVPLDTSECFFRSSRSI